LNGVASAIMTKNNVVSAPFSALIIKGFASRQPNSTSPPRWPNPEQRHPDADTSRLHLCLQAAAPIRA
jgi:hypothetical protein